MVLAKIGWKLIFLIARFPLSVRPLVHLLTWHLIIFFSKTTEILTTKHDTKHLFVRDLGLNKKQTIQ